MRLTDDLQAPESRQAMIFAVGVWVAAVPVFLAPSLTTGAVSPWALATYASIALVGVLLSPVVIVATRVAGSLARPWRLPLVVGTVAAVGALHGAVDVLLQEYWADILNDPGKVMKFIGADGRPVKPSFYLLAALNFLTLVWLHGVVAALAAVSRFHWIIRRQQSAIAAAARSKLEALRFQLNPHFLFNTLNVLSALILTSENDRADRLLGKLSEFLRATLVAPGPLVQLEQELAVVGAYLDIEGTRMGPRFEWEVDCPPSLSERMVPSLILLPIVEQAVAVAMRTVKPGAVVTVRAASRDRGRVLVLSVFGRASGPARATGSSRPDLAAVRERLSSHYGDAGTLAVEDGPRGFRAELAFPIGAKRDEASG